VTLYVDSSALLKRYVDEPDSPRCEAILLADPMWVTARHTELEVRRNLARLLFGPELDAARAAFFADWERMWVVELDGTTTALAASIAEDTGARTLDALHLAAARRIGSAPGFALLTFDVRQARAARSLGLAVAGM
jgi:predicted nucleic acid-binding protein